MKKGLSLLTLLILLLPSYCYSFDTQSLANNNYWKKLLHFRNGESEIDSPEFFLSTNGKKNPQDELKATITAVINNKKNIFCKFPARIKWLYQKIPSLEQKQPYQKCPELEKLIKQYKPSKAVLVFPTAHINSPASMFGHTFLRIDDKSGLPLTANAINYAADTQETNGLVFAYQGLFGGYKGRYSVLTYYKKIKEYSNLERRDIWEYELNLTKQEMIRLLMHLYEVKDTFAYYYFFSNNCSYNLLWLLEVARKNTNLVNQFSTQVIPIDSVRAVKKAGFITKSIYRPSKSKKIQALFTQEKNSSGLQKQAYRSEINTQLLQLKRSENKITKKEYIEELISQLSQRSQLPKLSKLQIKKPINPLLAHKTSKVSVAFNDNEQLELGIKPAFHDIYDVEKGFIKGAYIDFFDLKVIKNKKNKVKIKEFNIINIHSYAIRNNIFKPLSWGVSLGIKQFKKELNANLSTEVGITNRINNSIFSYVLLKTNVYYKKQIVLGIAPKLGIIHNLNNYKIGFSIENNYFNIVDNQLNAELFTTISTTKNTAINLKVSSQKIADFKIENIVNLSLFYYF